MTTNTPPDTTGAWHNARTMAPEAREAWQTALEDFAVARREAGDQPATLHRRRTHVRRFAVDTHRMPWWVSREDVLRWLDTLQGADSTRLTMLDSLRAFYRWAHASGRIGADPTHGPSYRGTRLAIPDTWAGELQAYERHLWTGGAAPNTVSAYRAFLATFARDHETGPYTVGIEDLYAWLGAKSWARETRRNRRGILVSFYDWAVSVGRCADNPAAYTPKVRAGEPVARPIAEADYAEALRRIDPRWVLAVRLGAEAGLRRAEVAEVHSSDLALDDGGRTWLTVHGKGAKLRRVPLSAGLAEAVRACGPGFIYPGNIITRRAQTGGAGHISPRWLGKNIGAALPEGVTMHALRHRFATRTYNVDRDVFTVQRLLGHASPATTQRYVQVADARMVALVDAVAS